MKKSLLALIMSVAILWVVISDACAAKEKNIDPSTVVSMSASVALQDITSSDVAQISGMEFIKIFKHAADFNEPRGMHSYLVSRQIASFMSSCCQGKDSALALMKENKFNFDGDVVDAFVGQGERYDYRLHGFDAVLKFSRPASIWYFPFFSKTYTITLYFIRDKLVRVTAKSFLQTV